MIGSPAIDIPTFVPPPHGRPFVADSALASGVAGRWSVRSFDSSRAVDASDVDALVDAARTAPSAYNLQPWRLWIAGRGTAEFDMILAALAEYNAEWAWRAPLLIVGIARDAASDGTAHPWADYDLGQATALLTVEANARGLGVCQMAGLDDSRLAALLECAPGERVAIVSAVGHPAADIDLGPVALEIQERGRNRRTRAEAAQVRLSAGA